MIGSELKSTFLKIISCFFLLYCFPEVLAEKTEKKKPENLRSLFFPPEEVNARGGYDSEKNTGGSEGPSSSPGGKLEAIYLGSLFFQSPHNWTLWVNGRRIMSHEEGHHQLPQGLKIEEVSESQVSFSFTLSPGGPLEGITLHPNQTYLIETQEIWEGDWRPED